LAFAEHRVCDGKDLVDHEEGAVGNAKNALLDGRDLFLRGEDLLPDGKGLFVCDEDLLHDGKHLFVFKHDALRLWKDVVSAPKHPRPNEGKANRHYEDARRRTNDFLREAPANGHPLPHDMPPGTELRQSQAGCFWSQPARIIVNSENSPADPTDRPQLYGIYAPQFLSSLFCLSDFFP
jgi:hypothetical protein